MASRRHALGWVAGVMVVAVSAPLWVDPGGAAEHSIDAGLEPPAVLFIVDASGSMRAELGRKVKMDIAKEALTSLVKGLPDTARVGLILYGHRRKNDCQDVEVAAPVGPVQKQKLMRAITAAKPLGMTPITTSLRQAVAALKGQPGESTIILVSDGEETCKADPCAVARELKAAGIHFVLHVVGFDVSAAQRRQLECIAAAGGGKYYSASGADELLFAAQQATTAVAAAVEPPASGEGKLWLESPESVPPAGPVIVRFEAAASFHDNAWAGIVPSSVPHGSEKTNDGHDLSYHYLRKRTAGMLTFAAPDAAGSYDVRMNDSDHDGREVASVSFRVGSVEGTVAADKKEYGVREEMTLSYTPAEGLAKSAWIAIVSSAAPHGNGKETDRHDVAYRYLEREKGTVKLPAPAQPGSYDARLMESGNGRELASATFSVRKATGQLFLERASFAPGEAVVVRFQVSEKLPRSAWAGIVPSAVPHGQESVNDQHELVYRYLGEAMSGTVTMPAPKNPGSYDMRLNDTDDGGSEIASVTFTVQAQ